MTPDHQKDCDEAFEQRFGKAAWGYTDRQRALNIWRAAWQARASLAAPAAPDSAEVAHAQRRVIEQADALLDIWDDGNKPHDQRVYVDGAFKDAMGDLRGLLNALRSAPQAPQGEPVLWCMVDKYGRHEAIVAYEGSSDLVADWNGAFPSRAPWRHAPLYAAPQAAPAAAPVGDGELWSFLRTVMAKGSDLGQRFRHGSLSYEHHSAHLDAEAAHFAQQLQAMLAASPAAPPPEQTQDLGRDRSVAKSDGVCGHHGAGWRPIESAPRDGAEILLVWLPPFGQSPAIVSARWLCRVHHYSSAAHCCPREADCDMGWDHFAGEFTHWMPLPAPPGATSAQMTTAVAETTAEGQTETSVDAERAAAPETGRLGIALEVAEQQADEARKCAHEWSDAGDSLRCDHCGKVEHRQPWEKPHD